MKTSRTNMNTSYMVENFGWAKNYIIFAGDDMHANKFRS